MRLWRRCLLFSVLLVGFGSVPAFPESQLIGKSPFLPPGYGEENDEPAAPVPVTQGPLSRDFEFRGVIQIGEAFQFSLFSKKEKKGYWIKEDETVSGISVADFNPNSGTVVVTKNNRSERITMVDATDSPLPVATSRPETSTAKASSTKQNRKVSENAKGKNRRVIPRRRVILPKKN